jgi:hypothetical protein
MVQVYFAQGHGFHEVINLVGRQLLQAQNRRFDELMTSKFTPMLKHHSLGKAKIRHNGRVYEATDRRSQAVKALLLPKRRLAWVSLLTEQLIPVRLRSGRIALIGANDLVADSALASMSRQSTRRIIIPLVIVGIGFAVTMAWLPSSSRPDSQFARSAATETHTVGKRDANAHNVDVEPHCSIQDAAQASMSAGKLYLLKSGLSRRFSVHFGIQSIVGGLAQIKAQACNKTFSATFIRDQRGWHLRDVSKD